MLRSLISRQTACLAVIFGVFALAAATVWPMRLYTEDHTYATALGITQISDEVTQEKDAGEYFIAQHDHLQTLEFYVNSVVSGTTATFQLFHVGEGSALTLVAQEEVTLPEEVPGYAFVSVDADTTVGDTYVYTVRGTDESRFTVGYEDEEAALATGTAVLYQTGFYNDTTVERAALKMRVMYRVPLSKWPSLLRMSVMALIAAAAALLVHLYYRARPQRNTKITVLRVLQLSLTPCILAAGGAAFIAVWPLRLFDSRLLDILIYETGIVLAAALALYALWHDRTGLPDLFSPGARHENPVLIHAAVIVCIALIMSCSADYMNATSELVHNIAMHRIVILMSLIVLLMGDIPSNTHAATLLTAAGASAAGLLYYLMNRVSADTADYERINAVLRTRAGAVAAAATAAVSVLVMLMLHRHRGEEKPPAGMAGISKRLVIPVLILAGLLLLFRNTRLWIPLLIIIWAMFYIRYRYWKGRAGLLRDLCWGILLDFVCKVAYSMLHRYYLAYHYSRFSMHFHTVTVTAYYLAIVSAAALTLYVAAFRETAGLDRRARFRRIWKETFLLGLAGAYMMMSLTRSGIGAFAVLVLAAAVFAGMSAGKGVKEGIKGTEKTEETAGRKKTEEIKGTEKTGETEGTEKIKETEGTEKTGETEGTERQEGKEGSEGKEGREGKGRKKGRGGWTAALNVQKAAGALLSMVLAVLVTFPAAFSGQRLISTAYGRPERFEELETYDDWVMRNMTWNCTRFMNVEIFIRDFGDRIIGGEIGSALYYGLGWNIPQGYRTAQAPSDSAGYDAGDPYSDYAAECLLAAVSEEDILPAAGDDDSASGALLLTASAETDAVSGLLLTAVEGGSLETGDISNGRIGLYLSYLRNLNLTGHDGMGVTLADGETAVHAHNIVLQVAYDCGIPTGVVFLAVLLLLLAGAFRHAGALCRYGEKTDAGGRYALLPLLLMTGFVVIGLVEWIFHFSNPFTITLLFSLAPVLFPEREDPAEMTERTDRR